MLGTADLFIATPRRKIAISLYQLKYIAVFTALPHMAPWESCSARMLEIVDRPAGRHFRAGPLWPAKRWPRKIVQRNLFSF